MLVSERQACVPAETVKQLKQLNEYSFSIPLLGESCVPGTSRIKAAQVNLTDIDRLILGPPILLHVHIKIGKKNTSRQVNK